MINTLKELKLQTSNLTDLSKINPLDINPLLIKFLSQEQKNQWFFCKMKCINPELVYKHNYINFNYIGKNTKSEIICPIEGHGSFWQLPLDHLRHQGCPICSTNQKKNTEWFINKSLLIHEDDYSYLLSNYINSSTKIEIICPIEGHGSFWQLPLDHLDGHGCPVCNFSKKEKLISKIIRDNRIKFETQWNFNKHKSLKRGRSAYLTFDFFLPDYNLCIEYDGEQHFKELSNRRYRITKEDLLFTQHKDRIKNQFCLDNNIRLVRIPYWIKPTNELILQLLEEKFTVKSILK